MNKASTSANGTLFCSMRWVAPRPQSNSSFCFPASTRILGPNRSMLGPGEPVPRRVTFRPCAGAEGTRPALASNSKTPVHQGCLLGARFIGKSSPVSFLGVYTLYRAAFRITVDIETSTPPISSVIVIHLSAPDSAILDDSSARRRLLSKNGHPGKSWPQIMRLRSLGLEFEIVHEVSDNVGIAFFMLRPQHVYVVMAT